MNGELAERERAILDMWPRFEDGEPVMVGDESTNNKDQRFTVKRIEFRHGKWMLNDSVTQGHYLNGKSGERVKRPAPEVLDADGVPIKVGDTVYELETGEEYKVERVFSGATDPDFPDHTIRCNKVADPITHVFKPDQLTHRHIVLDADGVEIHVGDTVYGVGRSQHSFDVIDPHHIDPEVGEAFSVRCYDRDEHEECHCKPKLLTHTRPDSWERLEEDAVKVVCEYAGAVPDEFGDYDCDTCRFYDERGKLICEQLMARDIVRRAKAIAGVEVDG